MRYVAAASLVLLLAAGCVGGGATERTIRVDYSSDEFATFALANFPSKIEVHPGDTLVIRQTWTGEPHTFTGGSQLSGIIKKAAGWLGFFEAFEALQDQGFPNPENPGDTSVGDFVAIAKKAKPATKRDELFDSYAALREQYPQLIALEEGSTAKFGDLAHKVDDASNNAFEGYPSAETDDGSIAQASALPCYLRRGGPPKDPKKPCSKANQRQPKFDGNQSFYSSGIIPYSGPQGNTYRIPLASDIKPGRYFFACLVHGPEQRTEVVVRPSGAKLPDPTTVTREVQSEIRELVSPLEKQFREAKSGTVTLGSGPSAQRVSGPFAGLTGLGRTGIDAFVPKTVHAKINEPITWRMMGAEHTITFNPPKYFPPIEFQEDGTVRYNPKLRPPAGGAKKWEPSENQQGPPKFDGGTYDGTGFWSSGLIGSDPYFEYTMRVSKPGTYPFACLIHAPMVGTLVVEPKE